MDAPTDHPPSFRSLGLSDARRYKENCNFLTFVRLFALQPGFQLALSIRLQQKLERIPVVGKIFRRILWYLTAILFNSECSPFAVYGKGILFPHPYCVVIGMYSRLGDNVTMYQETTLGLKSSDGVGYPSLGDGAVVYSGAKILGPVIIGKNATVGANSVVMIDVPDNSVAVGVPAKIIKSS